MTTPANDIDIQDVLAELARVIGQQAIDLAVSKAQLAAATKAPE